MKPLMTLDWTEDGFNEVYIEVMVVGVFRGRTSSSSVQTFRQKHASVRQTGGEAEAAWRRRLPRIVRWRQRIQAPYLFKEPSENSITMYFN